MGLENRTVVVVGAGAGGIGEAVVTLLGRLGCSVVAVDHDEARLRGTLAASAAGPMPCRGIVADALDAERIREVVAAAADSGPPLYGLVDVVGGLAPSQWGRVLDTAPRSFDEVIELNLNSTLYSSQAVAAALVDSGAPGSIVHIGSISGMDAAPFNASYGAAKAAVMSLTRTMAVELGSYGIRVNAVAPGTVARAGASIDAETARLARATIPLGRQGAPDDIAGAVAWLLSELSTFVTGQVITVDGGSSIKPSYLDEQDLPVFVRSAQLRTRLLGGG